MATATYQQIAAQLGMDYFPEAPPELLHGVQSLYSGIHHSFTDVLVRKDDRTVLAIGTLKYRIDPHGRRRVPVKPGRKTIAYMASDALHLPDFTIAPKGFGTGLLAGLVAMLGLPQVQIPEHPSFSRQYVVLSMQPDSTRRLLDREVLDVLAAHPGMELVARERRLSVSAGDRVLAPEEIPPFVQTAGQLLALLSRELKEAQQERWDPEAEAAHRIQQGSGLLVRALRSRLVSREELARFLEQPPPRTVPKALWKAVAGSSGFFYLWGGFFALIPLILSIAFWQQFGPAKGLIPLPISLVGFVAIALAYWYRTTRWRLLRQGRLCQARIRQVHQTLVVVNHQRRYKVVLEFELDGRKVTASVNAYGGQVDHARQLLADNQTARVLVDPANPKRVVWLDGYAS